MKATTNLLLFIALLTTSICKAQYTDEVNSNRPGKSMMAYSVGKSVFQTESGVNYITEIMKLKVQS